MAYASSVGLRLIILILGAIESYTSEHLSRLGLRRLYSGRTTRNDTWERSTVVSILKRVLQLHSSMERLPETTACEACRYPSKGSQRWTTVVTKLSVTFKGFMTPLKRMSLCKEYTISEKDLEDAYGRGTGPSPKSLKQLAGTIGSERFRKMKRNSRILFGSQMLLAGTERNLIWQRVSVM